MYLKTKKMNFLKWFYIVFFLYLHSKATSGKDSYMYNICKQQLPPKVCDYIIVGAGAAGATIAARLSEDPNIIVCLFEAGIKDTDQPVSPAIETPALWPTLAPGPVTWNYTTVLQKGLNGRKLFTGMGKTLGGSASHNVMTSSRGFKADFDYWAANGASGWSFEDVFHFFLKLENNVSPTLRNSPFHNTCGPVTISQTADYETVPLFKLLTRTAKEVGINMVDCNEPSPFGMCVPQYTIKNGKRESTSTAYLQPAMGRRNLYVVTEALVEKVLITSYHKKAFGIRYSKNGRVNYVKTRHEVILSGGSFGSPQLLQLSGIGPRSLLRKFKIRPHADLPAGINYHNHVQFPLEILLDIPVSSPEMLKDPVVMAEYIFRRTGKFSEVGGAVAAVYFDMVKQQLNWPEILSIFVDGITPQFDRSSERNGSTVLMWLIHPKSRGRVQIRSRDPHEPPLIDPRYLQEEIDVKTMIGGIRKLQRLVKSPAMKAANAIVSAGILPKACRHLKSDSDKQWECLLRSRSVDGSHPFSTCKMGSRYDKSAVVDHNLRVRGVKGLRVADASIMPEATSGFSMIPTIMIGEKAADMIKTDR